jgi:VanZ family protein
MSRWWLAVLAFVGVTVVMLWPMGGSGMPSSWPHLDKLVHFAAWFVLAVALWPSVRKWIGGSLGRVAVIVLALGVWGVAVELLQGLTPTRTPDAWDALADFLGGLAGAVAMLVYDRKATERTS